MPVHPGNAGHVGDYSAAVRFHMLKRRSTAEKCAAQVDVHHVVEGLRRGFSDAPAAKCAGVVDGDIHSAEVLTVIANSASTSASTLTSVWNHEGLPAFAGYSPCGFVAETFPARRDDHFRSFFAESKRNGLADTAAATGDNGHFFRQTGHVHHQLSTSMRNIRFSLTKPSGARSLIMGYKCTKIYGSHGVM